MKKVAIIIDGISASGSARAMGRAIDYGGVLNWGRAFRGGGAAPVMLVSATYYTTVDSGAEVDPVRRLVDWLEYNGYRVRTKERRLGGDRQENSTMHVEMAVDMMCMVGRVDEVLLFSGHQEMLAAVEAVQRCGLRVVVVSTKAEGFSVSAALQRGADDFIDLRTLENLVKERAVGPRPVDGLTNRHAAGSGR